jgi:hypothetical protein
MKWFWNRGLAGISARPAGPERRRRRLRAGSSMAVIVALAGISLPTVFAATASAMPPPIQPGRAADQHRAAEPAQAATH